MENISGIIHLSYCSVNDSIVLLTNDPSEFNRSQSEGDAIEPATTSTIEAPQPSRSEPSRSVQCDYNVTMHCVGLDYIRMKDDGSLELVPAGNEPDDRASFEVVEVEAPSEGKGKVFQLRNVRYKKYCLTGHRDSMKVDGHNDPNNDHWSHWTATKVQESQSVQHCFKLQLSARHFAKDWYFYIQDNSEFKIGQPRGLDVFQIETS